MDASARTDFVKGNVPSLQERNEVRPRDVQDIGGLLSRKLRFDTNHANGPTLQGLLLKRLLARVKAWL